MTTVLGRLALLLGAAMTLPSPAGPSESGMPPRRPDVAGTEAALTADHPLAVAAGADVLRRGGNAMDAAIAMAGVLAVVRPHMCGLGGDLFLLYRDGKTGQVHALNGSGRAGSRAKPDRFRQRGLERMPAQGVLSVTVPGASRAWADALERFGTISLTEALAPAIRHARDGFPVSTRFASDVAEEQARVAADPALAAVFLPGGRVPEVGSVLRQPDLARSLEALATRGVDALYKGELAQRIAAFMESEGGLLTGADLADHRSTWQEPLETPYRDHRLLAFPPNSQGVTLLQMMNLAEAADLATAGHNTVAYVEGWVRAKRLAYADRDRHVADPVFAEVPVARLLSKEHARSQWREGEAVPSAGGPQGTGDTVYLAVVDRQGNAVSLIQSLFHAFGSGRMVPGTGIVLHNRGALFNLDPGHPNRVAPGKRPYHTLCPAMALRPDGSLEMVFGTPGGDGQPQTLVQVFHNVALFGMTPQQAVEAPRFRHLENGTLALDDGFSEATRLALEARGLTIVPPTKPAEMGGAQVIQRLPSGALLTGADPRREAYAIAW